MRNQLPKEVRWVWDARWASYWFGDKEFFEFKKRDFDRKAEEMKKAGINAVITFGNFHFRWSFIDDWSKLLETLRNICDSCHKYGIKVVEHHSAILTFNPIAKKEWENMKDFFEKGCSSAINIHKHPGFLEQIERGDREYQGIKLSTMRQIDPRTGQFARTNYWGWIFCFNNPDWQRLYFQHLKDVYACGVDGIMTDDIAFYPRNYGCGCIYCREKFKKETGFEIPSTGMDDKEFYGNLENPAYRAFLLWRINCHKEHQERVFRHFRSLGLELARPIYTSSNTNSYGTRGMGSALDNLDGLYSTIFTEVNSTEPQGHCWLRIGAESKQRSALAYRNNLPPMCLFYPHNREENLFCWGMTKTWGQNYWGTNWRLNLKEETEMLSQTFNFESAHPELYRQPQPISEVAVLFFSRTVWLHKDRDKESDYIIMSDPASTDCWAGWCEILMLSNIPFDTIGENDLEEKRYFNRLRLIIVPNAVCLSNKAIKSLKEFASKGGKVIITHQSGLKDETGAGRGNYPFSGMVGADYKKIFEKSPEWITTKDNKLKIKRIDFSEAPVVSFKAHKDAISWMKLKNSNTPVLLYNQYGKGSVITFAGKPGRIVCVNRHKRFKKNGKEFAKIDFNRDQNVMNLMRESVEYLHTQPLLKTDNVPFGFIVGIFAHENRTVLHIINAVGTLSDSGKVVSIPEPLKFPRADNLPNGAKIMRLKIRRKGEKAILKSPEFSKEKELRCRREGEYAIIEVPASLVNCYSVIDIIS